MHSHLRGIVPVIPIPFDSNEEIDEQSFRAAVEFAASRKLAGMCLPAYGSEFYKLSDVERERVVRIAIEQNRGRVPVIAQANHPSAKIAADVAVCYERMGADMISFALPRQFAVSIGDLLTYSQRVAGAVSCRVLLQDFNPGGPTVGADFLVELKKQCPNLSFVKFEEPLLGEKFAAVRDRLGDSLGLLTGWAGCYLMQGLAAGSCGAMPGLATCDLLNYLFQLYVADQCDAATKLFEAVLPYLNYSMENFEFFLQIEKRFLVRRQIFRDARCRMLNRTPGAQELAYADVLIDRVMNVLWQLQLDLDGKDS